MCVCQAHVEQDDLGGTLGKGEHPQRLKAGLRLFCVVQINKGGKLTLGVKQDHHDVAFSLYALLLWDPCIKKVGIRVLLLFWGLMPVLLLPSCLSTSKKHEERGQKGRPKAQRRGSRWESYTRPLSAKGGWGGNPLRFFARGTVFSGQ